MKVAITGGRGFLGSQLARDLIDCGHTVVILSRSQLKEDLPARCAVKVVDYFDQAGLTTALSGVDALVHLAGIAHTKVKNNADKIYRAAIFDTTRNLFNAASSLDIKTFIYASSIKVYGDEPKQLPVTERTMCQPVCHYGKEKLNAERWLTETAKNTTTRLTVFRFPPMFGPGMRGSIRYFFTCAKYRIPLPLFNMRAKRNYLYVGNASRIIIAALMNELERELYIPHDQEIFDCGSLYSSIYEGIHGQQLPTFYRKLLLPAFLQNFLKNLEFLKPMFISFNLESCYRKEYLDLGLANFQEAVAKMKDKI